MEFSALLLSVSSPSETVRAGAERLITEYWQKNPLGYIEESFALGTQMSFVILANLLKRTERIQEQALATIIDRSISLMREVLRRPVATACTYVLAEAVVRASKSAADLSQRLEHAVSSSSAEAFRKNVAFFYRNLVSLLPAPADPVVFFTISNHLIYLAKEGVTIETLQAASDLWGTAPAGIDDLAEHLAQWTEISLQILETPQQAEPNLLAASISLLVTAARLDGFERFSSHACSAIVRLFPTLEDGSTLIYYPLLEFFRTSLFKNRLPQSHLDDVLRIVMELCNLKYDYPENNFYEMSGLEEFIKHVQLDFSVHSLRILAADFIAECIPESVYPEAVVSYVWSQNHQPKTALDFESALFLLTFPAEYSDLMDEKSLLMVQEIFQLAEQSQASVVLERFLMTHAEWARVFPSPPRGQMALANTSAKLDYSLLYSLKKHRLPEEVGPVMEYTLEKLEQYLDTEDMALLCLSVLKRLVKSGVTSRLMDLVLMAWERHWNSVMITTSVNEIISSVVKVHSQHSEVVLRFFLPRLYRYKNLQDFEIVAILEMLKIGILNFESDDTAALSQEIFDILMDIVSRSREDSEVIQIVTIITKGLIRLSGGQLDIQPLLDFLLGPSQDAFEGNKLFLGQLLAVKLFFSGGVDSSWILSALSTVTQLLFRVKRTSVQAGLLYFISYAINALDDSGVSEFLGAGELWEKLLDGIIGILEMGGLMEELYEDVLVAGVTRLVQFCLQSGANTCSRDLAMDAVGYLRYMHEMKLGDQERPSGGEFGPMDDDFFGVNGTQEEEEEEDDTSDFDIQEYKILEEFSRRHLETLGAFLSNIS